MQKNIAGQKWVAYAFNLTTNSPATGDAANITAIIIKDRGTENATADVNPTELSGGYYAFDISQAESNADLIVLRPSSVTPNIQVVGIPTAFFTTPLGSLVQQLIVSAVDALLRTILIANGYNTNLGLNVREWDLTALDPALETLRLEYRFEDADRKDATVGQQDMGLMIVIRIRTVSSIPLDDMCEMVADVSKAMHADPQWTQLANDTLQDGPVVFDKGEQADVASGAAIRYAIKYSVDRGMS